MSVTSHFITAPDGLKLHVRQYGESASPTLPVVCLAGLTRTSADFETLANALSADAGRRVVALDARGRGRSDYDRNPDNYNLTVELADVVAVLTALEIPRAVFVGTSRGGILTMLLASARPGVIAGAVLNDIGPVIEVAGLLRIKSYVGALPRLKSWAEGAELLRRLFGGQFAALSTPDWMAFARRTFREQDGALVQSYDARLAKGLKGVSLQRPPPPLWKDFDALARAPVLVIRGANSDILSQATVGAMVARHPDLDVLEVPDQGHAPLLVEDAVVRRIGAFIGRCETRHHALMA
jgi:pimeloyl-ACP methyl ester carboxylesterase